MILIFSKYDIKKIKKKIKITKAFVINRNIIFDKISSKTLSLYNDENRINDLIENIINCNLNIHIKMYFIKCVNSNRYDYIFYIDNTLNDDKMKNIINYVNNIKNLNINDVYNIKVDKIKDDFIFEKVVESSL